MAHDFDLFVIGGGSGGVRAARIAASYGAKVAIAEEYRFGGTCVIRGCVPKKLLVYASRFADDFEDARGFGWKSERPAFSWSDLIRAKDEEIGRLETVYQTNLERAGVKIFAERAEFENANTLQLKPSGQKISADKILIATGGHPNLDQSISGIEHAISSNEAFDLEKLPRRLVVAGGGYIAVEFAGIFAGLGVETTIVYRGEKILRGFDDDLRDHLSFAMKKRGIRIVTGNVFSKIEKTQGGSLIGHLSGGEAVEAGQIMFAIGRSPNVGGLGLADAGVKTGDKGNIIVDDEHRTSAQHIFAVGDVTDRVNLTPVAIRQGHAFADRQFGNMPNPLDYEMIPTAVFSTPEIGTVGLPEHEAAERVGELKIYKSQFRPMRATLAGRDEKMLMKLIVDAASDRVVGCHVLGDDAAEIVQMTAIAMRMGATKADFDSTMALHPSAAEELVTMREEWKPAAAAE